MDIFENNRAILEKNFPGISILLEKTLPSDEFSPFKAKTGFYTAHYKDVNLHSRMNPQREAERLILQEIKEPCSLCIFEGFGMGYPIAAFQQIYPDTPVLIYEPDVSLFKSVINLIDISPLFSKGTLSLMLGGKPDPAASIITEGSFVSIKTIKIRSTLKNYEEEYKQLDRIIHKCLHNKKVNLNTVKRFGGLWIRNLFSNMEKMIVCPGVETFKDRFTGFPALVVAAGPSLDSLLPYLNKLKEKTLIVCVDTAYRTLLYHHISPDFLVVVDPQYWNTRHLDNCSLDSTLLVSESSVHPSIFRTLKASNSQCFFCGSLFPLGEYIEGFIGKKGKLAAGGSVATTAWDFARYIGCTEIFTIGLDLGFPGRQTHARGSFFEERAHALSERKNPAELQSFHALNDAGPYFIKDYQDKDLLSDVRMEIYRNWFERQFEKYQNVTTLSLSPKSTALKGSDYLSLEVVLKKDSLRDDMNTIFKTLLSEKKQERSLSEIIPALKSLQNDLMELEQSTKRGIRIAEKILVKIRNKAPIASLLNEMDEVDKLIIGTESKELAGFLIQGLLQETSFSTKEDKETSSIDQSIKLYHQILESAEFHRNLLERSLKRFF